MFTLSIFVFVYILLFVIIFVKCIFLVIMPTVLIFFFEQLYFISVSTIDLSEVKLQDFFRSEAFRFAVGFAFDVFSVILLSIFSLCLLASAVSRAISKVTTCK